MRGPSDWKEGLAGWREDFKKSRSSTGNVLNPSGDAEWVVRLRLEFGGRGTEEVEAEVISELTSGALNPCCVAKMTKGLSAGGGERMELEAGDGEPSEWVLTAGPSLPFLRLHHCLQSPAPLLAGSVSLARSLPSAICPPAKTGET